MLLGQGDNKAHVLEVKHWLSKLVRLVHELESCVDSTFDEFAVSVRQDCAVRFPCQVMAKMNPSRNFVREGNHLGCVKSSAPSS